MSNQDATPHTDSGHSGGSKTTPAGPNSGFPTAKPGQVSGGTDGKGN
jgi:hypothetical protein